MEGDPITRPRYFEGQLLSADDFQAEQDYHTGMRRRHSRDLHGRGVVEGLEIELEDGQRIRVSPGMAIDGYGREIVVPEQTEVDLEEWMGEEALTLCLRYVERPGGSTRPSLKGEESGSEPDRIEESFDLAIERGVPATPPVRISDEECASAFSEEGEEVRPGERRDPQEDDACVVLATLQVSDGKVTLDDSTYRRRLPNAVDLYELILCLARRVRALERSVGLKERRGKGSSPSGGRRAR